MADKEVRERALKVYGDIIQKWNPDPDLGLHDGKTVLEARALAKMMAENLSRDEVVALIEIAGSFKPERSEYWTAMFFGVPMSGKTVFSDAPTYGIR